MKKVILGLVTILLAIPLVTLAAVKDFEINLQSSDATTEEVDGAWKKKTTIYAVTSGEDDVVTEAIIKLKPDKNNNSEVTKITCQGSTPYEVTTKKEGEFTVCTFKASKENAIKGSKVPVGTVEVTIPTSASNCDINYVVGKTNAKTGAEIDYAIIAVGLVGIGVLYFSTRSNRKIHNI